MTNHKQIIFSGVQPTGNFHLGNYLGALSQWLELQHNYNSIFCVVDYHAITVDQDPKHFHRQILDIAKIYLASGIDPKKSLIFKQSDISAHTELAWILNCIANSGELKRMTQFNDKSGILSLDTQKEEFEKTVKKEANLKTDKLMTELKEEANKNNYNLNLLIEKYEKDKVFDLINKSILSVIEKVKNNTGDYYTAVYKKLLGLIEDENKKFNKTSVGLFDYPVLMASDILLYNTDIVPVGDDQVQHLELTRDLAKRFNHKYGQTFKIPQAKIRAEGARIMGLDDPTKKMSKSAASPANFIALTDSIETAKKKIMRAVTDSGSDIKYDPKTKPAISNLLTIYSLLTKDSIKNIEKKYQGKGYGDFKKDLAEIVEKFLTDFQVKFNKISDRQVEKIFATSAKKLKPQAEATLNRAKQHLGL